MGAFPDQAPPRQTYRGSRLGGDSRRRTRSKKPVAGCSLLPVILRPPTYLSIYLSTLVDQFYTLFNFRFGDLGHGVWRGERSAGVVRGRLLLRLIAREAGKSNGQQPGGRGGRLRQRSGDGEDARRPGAPPRPASHRAGPPAPRPGRAVDPARGPRAGEAAGARGEPRAHRGAAGAC